MLRRQDLPPIFREVAEKARGNALVAALQAYGGEITLSPDVMDKARGHQVIMMVTPEGYPKFYLQRKPKS